MYECNFNTDYLKKAVQYNNYLLKHFWDRDNGGFFFAGDDNSDLPVRQKEIYDGAVPSGNSTAMLNLIRLSRFTGEPDLQAKAFDIADAFADTLKQSPSAFTQTLIALDFAAGPSYEIVIAGERNSADTLQFLKEIRKIYAPNRILLLNDGGDINKIATFIENKIRKENLTTLYVCRNYSCNNPITSPDKIVDLLN